MDSFLLLSYFALLSHPFLFLLFDVLIDYFWNFAEVFVFSKPKNKTKTNKKKKKIVYKINWKGVQ